MYIFLLNVFFPGQTRGKITFAQTLFPEHTLSLIIIVHIYVWGKYRKSFSSHLCKDKNIFLKAESKRRIRKWIKLDCAETWKYLILCGENWCKIDSDKCGWVVWATVELHIWHKKWYSSAISLSIILNRSSIWRRFGRYHL